MKTLRSFKEKGLLQKIIIVIGALLIINTIQMAFIQNFHLGFLALAVISVAVFTYGVKFDKLKKARGLHITVVCLCLICFVFAGFLSSYGRNENVTYTEDAVIVLGAGLRGDEPGRALSYRLDRAVLYHLKNPDALIIVSGGQGPQENISEALAMEGYLINRGVPREQIIREENSTSTYENFSFSREILKKQFPDGFSAAFVTNYFHVYRAERIAEYAELSLSHMGAGISWYSIPVNYLREMMALLQFWFLPELMT